MAKNKSEKISSKTLPYHRLVVKFGTSLLTGGSDYHGLDESAETLIGGANVPVESAEQLIALAEQGMLKPASP